MASLLAAVLAAGMLPMSAVTVFAKDPGFTDLQAEIDAAEAGGTVKLDADYTYKESVTTEPWTVAIDKNIILDLNGHTISGANTNGRSVITVKAGAEVELIDSSASKNGIITCGNSYLNTAETSGGVYIETGGSFTMTSGTISGNRTYPAGGGVTNYGTFTMNGGTISDNASGYEAGGVYNAGTFTMNGGTISGNTANNVGGGVFKNYNGDFTMLGGEITSNKATNSAGGVYGSTTVGGDANITGNQKGNGIANNLYCDYYMKITISDAKPLTGNASIGISSADTPTKDSPVTFSNTVTTDCSGYFSSDNSAYGVKFNTDHLELVKLAEYKIIAGADGKLTKDAVVDHSITGDGSYADFVKLNMDGQVVDAANYAVKSGSTIVTFKKAYLETLSVGKHEVEMIWKDGIAKTTLTIAEAPGNPETGDSTNMILWFSIFAAAASALAVMMVRGRRER